MGCKTMNDTGSKKNTLETPQTAIKAIRAKCLDCSAGSPAEVRACELTHCPLYKFRLGKNPNIGKREMSDEQRAAAADRLSKAREAKGAA